MAVSRTNGLQVISTGLNKVPDVQMRRHRGRAGATSTNARTTYVAKIDAGGSVEVMASYDDSTNILLKHCFGAVAESGAGPYVHTYTLATAGYTGLTLEQGVGAANADTYAGSLIHDWELKVTGNGEMRLVL